MEEEIVENQNNSKKKSTFVQDAYDIIQIFVQAIVVITIIFIFLFRIAGVSGDSMLPTFHDGDWLVLSNLGYSAKRGEVVVISQPNILNEPLIKRIIAVGGETINIEDNGDITIDGKVIDEPYIAEITKIRGDGGVTFPHKVPEGYVFVMGDNRNESADSRFSYIGDIDTRYIVGEAKARLFPIGNFKIDYSEMKYEIDEK